MKRFLPLVGVISLLSLAISSVPLWPQLAKGLPHCPFKAFVGLPCPTCGTTTAFLFLGEGKWLLALQANPLAMASFLAFTAGLAFLATRYALHQPLPQFAHRLQFFWPTWLRVAFVLLLVVNWLWVLGQGW